MSMPLIIPARNEEVVIGETLASLDARLVEPIVVVNDSSDSTAEISSSFGARTIETDIPGKLPAMQLAMKCLGDRALSGFLVLDADSQPLFPTQWSKAMIKTAGKDDLPSLVGGPVVWSGDKRPGVYNLIASFAYEANARLPKSPSIPEANLFIRPSNKAALNEMVEIEHWYPGEGRAIAKVVTDMGGQYTRAINPFAIVKTSDRYTRNLGSRSEHWLERYKKRAPEGSSVPHHLF